MIYVRNAQIACKSTQTHAHDNRNIWHAMESGAYSPSALLTAMKTIDVSLYEVPVNIKLIFANIFTAAEEI